MNKDLKQYGTTGLVVKGNAMTGGGIEGPLEVMFAALLGGLAGFVAGMLFGTVTRVMTINRVKGMLGGGHWAAYGAAAGALCLALVEWLD
jgi:hypothetical protein